LLLEAYRPLLANAGFCKLEALAKTCRHVSRFWNRTWPQIHQHVFGPMESGSGLKGVSARRVRNCCYHRS